MELIMGSNKILDGVLIKKANTQEHYTENIIQDLVKCSDPETGYLYFMKNFFYIQHPVRGKIKFEPYGYQLNLLESYHKHRFSVSLMPRQSGKCVTGDTLIKIKNKHTGEELDITIEQFFKLQQGNNHD